MLWMQRSVFHAKVCSVNTSVMELHEKNLSQLRSKVRKHIWCTFVAFRKIKISSVAVLFAERKKEKLYTEETSLS